ncbi:MAG: GGDEF domain-containing protein [Hydrogenophilales bacterium]|nr:GGDEF domain-containing protein [Hydrogenophilales bacterium]
MQLLDMFTGRAGLIAAWALTALLIVFLGLARVGTDAQFAFASAAIIPIFLVTWAGGFRHGFLASAFAVAMWVVSDVWVAWDADHAWIQGVNGMTRLATYSFVAWLTARIRAMHARELELSRLDPLTGLRNRRAFMELGEMEVARAARYAQPLALAYLDLDNFKQLNDRFGHAAGDAALVAVGRALDATMRGSDAVARLGGDEFAVILQGIDRSKADQAGERIAGAVANALTSHRPVTASMGIAVFEQPPGDFQTMLKAADALMYEVKQTGKGRVLIRTAHSQNDT